MTNELQQRTSKMTKPATCQQCGGDVLLEVDFGEPDSQDARILAECDDCGNSAWLSWEEIPSRRAEQSEVR